MRVRNVQVAQLKASRDKLLAELERQFLEVDRLSVENSALSQVCQSLILLNLPLFSGHNSSAHDVLLSLRKFGQPHRCASHERGHAEVWV